MELKTPVCTHARNVTQEQPHRLTMPELPAFFGVPRLWAAQDTSIATAVIGRDMLLVVPTGEGKSFAFWGAHLCRGGLAVIISPLRSLMADQQRRCEALGIRSAVWNSDTAEPAKEEIAQDIRGGWQGVLYVSPEGLDRPALRDLLKGRVDMVVIDEAHMALEARSFRSNYGRLGRIIDDIGPAVRFACTATLSVEDRPELIRTLGLTDPCICYSPVARSNIQIERIERSEEAATDILDQHEGETGIVYCATVANCESLHATFTSQGRDVLIYHGKMNASNRRAAQTAFTSSSAPVAVATDAFLLGIDRADVRWTLTFDYPANVEGWVQGFGRAGRDGLPAKAYGAFVNADEGRSRREFLIRSSHPELADIQAIWHFLISRPSCDMAQHAIGEQVLGSRGKYCAASCIAALKRRELVIATPHPDDGRRRVYRGRGDFARVNWSGHEAERRRAFDNFERLHQIVQLPARSIASAIDDYFAGADA